ncbi:hypothetical protein CHS0354_041634 [Potamilus streckersoni]|uniref:NF-X1-type domain-containing protein n=1 Tax=Potamilus streckersoni TaxID=2493646 RepID=A0AAE0VT06_9BIVA|nr:hypothetical protein CHS0354_041634 [Potamilus streckersoni]
MDSSSSSEREEHIMDNAKNKTQSGSFRRRGNRFSKQQHSTRRKRKFSFDHSNAHRANIYEENNPGNSRRRMLSLENSTQDQKHNLSLRDTCTRPQKRRISNKESSSILHVPVKQMRSEEARRVSSKNLQMNMQDRIVQFLNALHKAYVTDSNSVAIFLATENGEFENTLFLKKEFEDIDHIIAILSSLADSSCLENVSKALCIITKQSIFKRQDVLSRLDGIFMEGRCKEKDLQFIENLLKLANLMTNYSSAIFQVEYLLTNLSSIIPPENQSLRRSVNDIKLKCKNQKSGENKTVSHVKIIPTSSEIMDNRRILFPSHDLRKPFKNTQEYLDRMFRLFREDFVRPLKRGLSDYIEHIKTKTEGKFVHSDVILYPDVRLVESRCSCNDGVVWDAQLEARNRNRRHFKFSNALRRGSLICLFPAGSTDFYFATVTDKSMEKFRNGIIGIQFIDVSFEIQFKLTGMSLTMVESKSFYTAYSFSLKCLQKLAEQCSQETFCMPFEEYFVHLKTKIKYPRYLQVKEPIVSFQCLMSNEKACHDLTSVDICKDGENNCLHPTREQSPRCSRFDSRDKVNLLDTDAWPSEKDLQLDYSQLQALKQALTNEIALIQGPPGTGKTMMGLTITNFLLNNEHLWRYPGVGPILLMSYTNHALDQFLKEILKMPVVRNGCENDIVRIGSRSEEEEIKKFNITVHRRQVFNRSVRKCRGKLASRERKYESVNSWINQHYSGLVHEDYLLQVQSMSYEQYISLKEKSFLARFLPENETMFIEWLSLLTTMESVFINIKTDEVETFASLVREEIDEESKNFPELDEQSDERNETEFADEINLRSVRMACDKSILFPEEEKESAEKDPQEISVWCNFPKLGRQRLLDFILHSVAYGEKMSIEEASKIKDVWKLPEKDRWKLYRFWIAESTQVVKEKLVKDAESYSRGQKRYCEARASVDAQIMKGAKLVASTTTGACMNIETIRKACPSIVIVEEAAQVPDHHLIASLPQSCQHLIMIGDHFQLQPSYIDFGLAKEHHTDISMFERLATSGIEFKQLQFQHRMRPTISRYLRPHIYEVLNDHKAVKTYPDVKGVKRNVFFLNHKEQEDQTETSYSNSFEAKFIAQMYRYLRLQGYRKKEITILSPYNAQVRLLRQVIREMEKNDQLIGGCKGKNIPSNQVNEDVEYLSDKRIHEKRMVSINQNTDLNFDSLTTQDIDTIKLETFDDNRKGVRITALDNFQGEENAIILLSLVRSNTRRSIGYLDKRNRICVALSRAKIGFYIIGNMELLSSLNTIWKHIISDAKRDGNIGSFIELACQNHPNRVTKVSRSEDFKTISEGGCDLRCNYSKSCGHTCKRLCHLDNLSHMDFCDEICRKPLCKRGHKCHKKCSEDCGLCREKVKKVLPKCGHEQIVPCHMDPNESQCENRCDRTISCGHRCQKKCGQPCNTEANCNELVKAVAECSHEIQAACHAKLNPPCSVACRITLECGHVCKGTCSSCFYGRVHQPCREQCNKFLVCGHKCRAKCGVPCPPCSQYSSCYCEHQNEINLKPKCMEDQSPCKQICEWKCRYGCPNKFSCSNVCGDPCDRKRCNSPCFKRSNDCNHRKQCVGLNCEPCICLDCARNNVQRLGDARRDGDIRYIKLVDCGHIFQVNSLDGYIDKILKDHEKKRIWVLSCPFCGCPIEKTQRYTKERNTLRKKLQKIKETHLLINEPKQMEENRDLFLRHLDDLEMEDIDTISESCRRSKSLSRNVLIFFTNQFRFIKTVGDIKSKLCQADDEHLDASHFEFLKTRLDHLKRRVIGEKTRRIHFTIQELREFSDEILRLSLLAGCAVINGRLMNYDLYTGKTNAIRRAIKNIETDLGKQSGSMKLPLQSLKDRFAAHVGKIASNLIPETVHVLYPVGYSAEDWYVCSNGHCYYTRRGCEEGNSCPNCNRGRNERTPWLSMV